MVTLMMLACWLKLGKNSWRDDVVRFSQHERVDVGGVCSVSLVDNQHTCSAIPTIILWSILETCHKGHQICQMLKERGKCVAMGFAWTFFL